jgi:hypothetical protein
MSFSQYLFLLQDEAERSTNEMQFQTVGLSKMRHQYLRYFLLISILFQQFPSSTACSETRGNVSVFEERVLLLLCYSEATRTREKATFSVGNSPHPAPDANELDVAWCAGCWRIGAATLVLGSHPCPVRRHEYSQGKNECVYVTAGWFT